MIRLLCCIVILAYAISAMDWRERPTSPEPWSEFDAYKVRVK